METKAKTFPNNSEHPLTFKEMCLRHTQQMHNNSSSLTFHSHTHARNNTVPYTDYTPINHVSLTTHLPVTHTTKDKNSASEITQEAFFDEEETTKEHYRAEPDHITQKTGMWLGCFGNAGILCGAASVLSFGSGDWLPHNEKIALGWMGMVGLCFIVMAVSCTTIGVMEYI